MNQSALPYDFDGPAIIDALQIHDRRQAQRFFGGSESVEVMFVRFEAAVLNGGEQTICVDLVLRNERRKVFVILGVVVAASGAIQFPPRFKGIADERFGRIAQAIAQEMVNRTPQQLELRLLAENPEIQPQDLTIERVLPGVRDYCTAVNHLKRYAWIREHLSGGSVLDCASGTGYGACMLLHRQDVTRYVGVDLSDVAVGWASRLVDDPRASFERRFLSEVEETGFQNVVSLETIEHVPDPHEFLLDLSAKLHPEGRLLLSLPTERWGGSHLNPFHFTNWTYPRFERLVATFFSDWKIYKQRLSLLGPDTFGASEILDREARPDEDECFVAILRGPKRIRPRRVIIRRTAALGDVVWATPVVEAVRRAHPDHHTVVVTAQTEVFLNNPNVDLLALPQFEPRAGDRVIDLDWAYEKRRGQHLLEAYFQVAGLPVTTARPALHPYWDDFVSAWQAMRTLTAAGGIARFIAIHTGGSVHRIWPGEHWRALVEKLAGDESLGFVFVGAGSDPRPSELGLAPEILERSLDLVGRRNLSGTAAVLALCDLLVAVDSGLSHVAYAVGTPVVVLFGMAMPETRWDLTGNTTPVVTPLACRGCIASIPPEAAPLCPLGTGECMAAITPEMVYDAVTRRLQGGSTSRAASWRAVLEPQPRQAAEASGPVTVAVFSIDHVGGACHTVRLADPLALLGRYVRILWFDPTREADEAENLIAQADLILVQRAFPGPGTEVVMERIFASGKPVVHELDDDLFGLPPGHVDQGQIGPRLQETERALRRAHLVIASTPTLARKLAQWNAAVTVVPNQLAFARWADVVDGPAPVREVVTVGFAGTITHQADLRMIEGALLRVAAIYGDRVRFVFWGAVTDTLRTLPNATWINTGLSYGAYASRLAQLRFDIGLAPLEDTPFNRCKSDIKWLEYAAVGAAAIVSDLDPYAEAKARGLAVAVPNEEEAWFQAICRLIDDASLRTRLTEAARAYVLTERILERHLADYAQAFNRVLPPDRRLPGDGLVPMPLPPYDPADDFMPGPAYRRWLESRQLREVDAEVLAHRFGHLAEKTVGLVCVAARRDWDKLADTVDALQGLLAQNWRLIVVSDAPCPEAAFESSEHLGWLDLGDVSDPEAVAAAVNAIVSEVDMDFVGLIPPGTRFAPEALVLVANYFGARPEWQALYTDHDDLDPAGERFRPWLKPKLNREYLRAMDYVGPAVFFRRAAWLELGGVEPYPHHESHELLLRVLERFGEAAIGHVGEVLLSLPLAERDPHLSEAALRVAVENHLARCGEAATVSPGIAPETLRIEYRHETEPLVSVIIPTRNRTDLMEPCLRTLTERTAYPRLEIIVVDNQSDDPDLFALYEEYRARLGDRFRVIEYDAPFNFSAEVNAGVAESRGEVVVLLNNDTEIIDGAWLERMLHHALRPEVGAVGALLVAPESGQIQHAGVWLGWPGGLTSVADHAFLGAWLGDPGYMRRLQVDQEYEAVTAACVMVRRNVYEELNGFDADNLGVLFNDVDFCLRLRERGYRVIFTPHARLMHRVNASINEVSADPERALASAVRGKREREYMLARWLPRLSTDSATSRHWSLRHTLPTLEQGAPLAWNPDFHDRPRVLGFPIPGGSGEYRVRIPLEGLSRQGWAHAGLVRSGKNGVALPSVVELARQAPDTLLLHSTSAPVAREYFSTWRRHLPDIRLVFGLDDRFGAIPEKSDLHLAHRRHNPDIRYRLRKLLEHCDRAVVSTVPLAEFIGDMIGDVRVIPNALEREVWEPLKPRRGVGPRPRVGWVGATQHRGDLELILEVVRATHRHVDWVFMGMWLPEFAGLVKERHPGVPFRQYPAAMAALNLDLAVAPLEINAFNEAKSNLRLLEYGALGWPVICTDIYPYRENSPPVTRLPNEPQLWIEAILAKIADPDALAAEGETLRRWVAEHYWLEHHLDAWHRALFE